MNLFFGLVWLIFPNWISYMVHWMVPLSSFHSAWKDPRGSKGFKWFCSFPIGGWILRTG